jgi:hypothetical protein
MLGLFWWGGIVIPSDGKDLVRWTYSYFGSEDRHKRQFDSKY